MSGFDPSAYDSAVGDEYDLLYPSEAFETETAVTVLAALAHDHGDKSVIEFGIGTGRIALGLHRLGLAVSGIDDQKGWSLSFGANPKEHRYL